MSAGLWSTTSERAVCMCRVLGLREVGEEKRDKKKLHFAFLLSSCSGITVVGGPAPIKSRKLMWGNIDTPIHIFPQLTQL